MTERTTGPSAAPCEACGAAPGQPCRDDCEVAAVQASLDAQRPEPPYEVLLVTADGCDAVSWTADDWDDALRSLQVTAQNRAEEMAAQTRRAGGDPQFRLQVSTPVDGHGIIYSVDVHRQRLGIPETEFRYHIRPNTPEDWASLIDVQWCEPNQTWLVSARTSGSVPWTHMEGDTGELAEMLAQAQQIAVEGDVSVPLEVHVLRIVLMEPYGVEPMVTVHRTLDSAKRQIAETAREYGVDTIITRQHAGHEDEYGDIGEGIDTQVDAPWLSWSIVREPLQG